MARPHWLLGLTVVGLAGCQPPAVLQLPAIERLPDRELSLTRDVAGTLSLSVAISAAERSVQALPASWDTATLHLTHPTALSSPRVQSLTKGVQLTPNGSGGYTATGAFGLLRPAPGYTLTVSLWSAGMLVGEKALTLDLAAGPNAVTVPIEVYPALGLVGFSPAYGFVGDTVTLSGQGFSVLPGQDLLSLGGVSATVSAAASGSLTTTVPDVPASIASWQLQVGSSLAGRTGFSLLGLMGSALSWVSLASSQLTPAIALGSGEYLVAWQDDRLGASDHGLYARRVGVTGSLVGSEITIADGAGHQRYPEVAYNSTLGQYAVVYEDAVNSGDVRGQIVNADGTLSGTTFGLATGAFPQSKPRLTFNPASGQYAVVWAENRTGTSDVYGLRFAANGLPVGSAALAGGGSGNQENPVIATDPASGRMLLVWEDDSSGVRRLKGLISSSAAALVVGPFDLTPSETVPQAEPRIAVDTGTGEFLVAWVSQASPQQVVARRVSTAGALGATFTVGDGPGTKGAPRLAYQPYRQKFLVTWTDGRNGAPDVYGQYVGSDGTRWGANFAIASGAGDQGPAAVGVDPAGRTAMVAYQDAANAGDLKAQRVR